MLKFRYGIYRQMFSCSLRVLLFYCMFKYFNVLCENSLFKKKLFRWNETRNWRQLSIRYKNKFSSRVGCNELIATLHPYIPEKAVAPNSSTFAWKIPWTEEPGGLQSMGSIRVRHDCATSLSLFTVMPWRRKWQPTPVFLLRESHGWGNLVGAVYGVAQSRTRLKWLSSSSIHTFTHQIFT